MDRQQPGSVTNAVRVLGGLVLLSGLTAVLTFVFRDDLVRSWAEGNTAARTMLEQGGMAALRRSSIAPPAFVRVAIVLFVVFAALAGVLVAFFRGGHHWARVALSALAIFMAVASLAGLRTSPPLFFEVLSVVSVLLDAALLLFMWHPDTSAYLRGTWAPDRPGRPGRSDRVS